MEQIVITREELHQMVWSTPFIMLAKKYNISDVGLRKACIRLGVPFPKTGHWQRIRAGKKVTVQPLPPYNSQDKTIKLALRDDKAGTTTDEAGIRLEIQGDSRVSLKVPSSLRSPHRHIALAKADLIEGRYRHSEDLLSTHVNLLRIVTSRRNLGRCLRFLDTLLKAVEARGHGIEVEGMTNYFIVFGERIKFNMREKTTKIPQEVKAPAWESTKYAPTGILSFCIEASWHRFEWKDSKQLIEEKIISIISKIEIQAELMREATRQAIRAREEREKMEKEERELEQKKTVEAERFRDLLNDAIRWHLSKIIGDYLKAKKELMTRDGEEHNKWAESKLEWFDPLIAKVDPILTAEDILKYAFYHPARIAPKPFWT